MEELYKCYKCEVELGWAETDDEKGSIWSCENCDRSVCSKCLEKFYNKSISDIVDEQILCEHCLKLVK